MSETVFFRDVVVSAIGGGWGSDESIGNDARVAVIRGTDFESVAFGNTANVPIRYEKISKLASRTLIDGDLLLEISGGSSAKGQPTGRSLLVRSQWLEPLGVPVIPASFCRLVRIDRSRVLPQYAYYALQDMHRSGRAFEYENRSTGISNFQFQHFLDAERLFLPSFADQKAVANTLGALDDKIALNRRLSGTLEAIAQALFQSWFVDFDPVRAKASGEATDAICQRLGLTAELLALFPDRLVDSEMGEIPEGWTWSDIGSQVKVLGGGTPSTKNPEYWDEGSIYWATPKDLSGNTSKVILATDRKITEAGLSSITSELLPEDTVLLSSRAPVGYLTLTKAPMAINQGFIAMKCDALLTPEYVLHWAMFSMPEIQQRASGTTFQEISKKNFRTIPVLIPDDAVVEAFSISAKFIYEKISENVAENISLGEMRDSLLPKLLSGEISPDGERDD